MKEALHHIRKAFIAKLDGSVLLRGNAVPVYNRVPSNASFPYIRVYSLSNNSVDQNRDSFNSVAITRVEVVTRFDSDSGGELDCNLIVSECLSLLITRSANYIDLVADDFNVYTSTNEGVTYLEEDNNDHTYFRAIIEIGNRVEGI